MLSKEEAKIPENFDEFRASLLKGMFRNGIMIGGKIMGIKEDLLDMENRSRFMDAMDLSANQEGSNLFLQNLDENGNPIEKIDYAEGVRMMRLNREGRIIEIFESDEEDSSSKEGEEKNINKARNAAATVAGKKGIQPEALTAQKKGSNVPKQILQSRRGEPPVS